MRADAGPNAAHSSRGSERLHEGRRPEEEKDCARGFGSRSFQMGEEVSHRGSYLGGRCCRTKSAGGSILPRVVSDPKYFNSTDMPSFSSEKITTAYICAVRALALSNELVFGGSSSRDDGERNASSGLLRSGSGRPRSVVVEGLSESGEARR